MSTRNRVRRSKDRRVFSRAADKVKKININPKVARGGIRL